MKHVFTSILVVFSLISTLFAQQITRQGFETSGDNWPFTAAPTPYNNTADADVWDDTTATAQMGAADGQRFWFMQDLENPNGGFAGFHTLDFAPIDVSAFSNNTLSFRFQTLAYDATDSIGYIVAYDNGTAWNMADRVLLPPNTAAWQTVLINVPASSPFVRLRLMAKQNGGSDFAGFDEIVLSSSAGDMVAPQVLSAATTTANSILLVFSEKLDAASAQDLANFTGIAGLSAAQLSPSGDSVRLVFSQNFADGVAQNLTVSTGVKDVAGNGLAQPFNHNFIWNGGQPALVVTEIMYNNPAADTLEFIEIYNFGNAAVPIGGLKIEGSVAFEFPEMMLEKGKTVLLALEKDKAESFFTGKTFLDWSNGALGNGDGTIRIVNSAGAILDEVIYDDVAPWPFEPDGLGPSLELISPNLNNALGENWQASLSPFGTTGGIFATPDSVRVISLPTLSFKKTSTLFDEKNTTVKLEVSPSAAPIVDATVEIRFNQFSKAAAGVDYVLPVQFLTFPKDSTASQFIDIQWLNNAQADGSRYLMVEIFNPTAAVLGANTGHLVQANDDDAPVPQAAPSVLSLRHLGSLRVDTTAGPSAEISAYEPVSRRLFSTNALENSLEIVDFKDPYALKKLTKINLKPFGGGPNSVVALQGFVAVAIEDSTKMGNGRVVFFDKDGVLVNSVEVGNLPDNLVLSPDGKKLLTANEGEPSTDYLIDPEGSVSIINVEPGVQNLTQANVATLDFQAFNGTEATLRAQGGRVFGPGSTLAQDIEPEYIAISDDSKMAYVTCQENNAIAVVNLENFQIQSLTGLGLKDWSASSLDASDRPAGIFSHNWPIKGVFMPDAIDFFSVGGQNFLLTANEGDSREYSAYSEVGRVGDASYLLDPTVFPDASLLKNQNLLGRMTVTKASGDTDGDGDFDEIHTLGARSISIWDASTGALVWDSGSDFERITAADPVFGPMFNASNANNTLKNRSDDKGPEPESALVADIEGRKIAFAGMERIGGIMAYDVTVPTAPVFLQYINTRSLGATVGGDLGPEGLLFISKNESPNQRNLLVVSNEISGTVGVFQIELDRTKSGEFSSQVFELKISDTIGIYGEIINEGGFSGMHYLPGTDNEFLIVGDRGPNAAASASPLAAGQNVLIFPFQDYAPKIFRVKAEAGEIKILDTKSIKNPTGSDISGRPLPVGQGNTGEIAWSDTLGTIAPNDVWGADTEGIVEDNEGHLWVCEEYGSAVLKLEKATGRILQRFTPWPTQPQDLPLDNLIGKRRANRGFEGIAYTPNGKIFAILQSPVENPTAAASTASRLHRLVEIDPLTNQMRTFAYEHDPVLGAIRSQDWKIGDLVAVNNDEFLLIEHAERNGWNSKNIYKISLVGATPVVGNDFGGKTLEQLNTAAAAAAAGIQVVQKTLFADLLELGWDRKLDKPEGLTILNDSTFAVGNDNDFGIDAPELDGKIVLTGKKSKLYIFGVPAAKKLNYVSPYCKTDLSATAAAACPGGSVELTAAGDFTNFNWSNGAISAPTATVAAGDTVFLTAVSAVGCTARDTFAVGLFAVPTVDLGVDVSLCPGFSTIFETNDQPAGTTYLWSNGSTQFSISASAAGDYFLTATNLDGCANSDTVSVISLTQPTVDLGADEKICPGATAILAANSQPGGTIFNWSNGAATSEITVSTAGQFILTATNSDGCSASDSVSVISLTQPTVDLGADEKICPGATTILAANNQPGGTIFNWSNGATTSEITVSTAGQFILTATNADGCSASDSVLVNLGQVPAVNLGPDTLICEGQTVVLAAQTGTGYLWSNGATTAQITVSTEANYSVVVTSADGCTASDAVFVDVQVCTATKNLSEIGGLNVFPNPTAGLFFVEIELKKASRANLFLSDATGRLVKTMPGQLLSEGKNRIEMDGSELPNGLYFLSVKTENGQVSRKIVVARD